MAHELEAKNILVVTSQPTTSLLPDYLRHTGYTEAIYVLSVDELQGVSLPYCDLLICEYLPERETLEKLLSRCISTPRHLLSHSIRPALAGVASSVASISRSLHVSRLT